MRDTIVALQPRRDVSTVNLIHANNSDC